MAAVTACIRQGALVLRTRARSCSASSSFSSSSLSATSNRFSSSPFSPQALRSAGKGVALPVASLENLPPALSLVLLETLASVNHGSTLDLLCSSPSHCPPPAPHLRLPQPHVAVTPTPRTPLPLPFATSALGSVLLATPLLLSLLVLAQPAAASAAAEALDPSAEQLPSLLDSVPGFGTPADFSGLAGGAVLSLAFLPQADSPFWENVGRFVVYFVTVLTGGLFSLLRPLYDLAKNPLTLLLLILLLGGGFSFAYLTLNAMLGLNDPGIVVVQ